MNELSLQHENIEQKAEIGVSMIPMLRAKWEFIAPSSAMDFEEVDEKLTILNANEDKFSSEFEEENDTPDGKNYTQANVEEFVKKLVRRNANLDKRTVRYRRYAQA